MKFDIQKLLTEMKRDKSLMLSVDERQGMEDRLKEYMAFKPLPTRTPYVFSYVHVTAFRTVAAALVLALLSTGTVSYAAEGTLPGDTLYPVKIHVNENVRRTLARTPEARATVESELASRRIDEAHELAKQNRLSAEVRVTLEDDFDEHADRAAEETEKIQKKDARRARDAAARFEAKLAERKAKLNELRHEDSDELSQKLEERSKKIAEFREKLDDHRGRGGGDEDEHEDDHSGSGEGGHEED